MEVPYMEHKNFYNIDKELLDKIINLIDKVADKLSA